MQIHWAVFGERNGGHALLAASGNKEFAGRITQYSDRPGDPPMGIEWGPVYSGFHFADHYVIMCTLPDPTAGRAGMVRSYAAYAPVRDMSLLGRLLPVVNALPLNLEKPPSTLEPLEISESALGKSVRESPPGLVDIARQIGTLNAAQPMIWASEAPYLPTIDAFWARLPATLRPAFAFGFQFAPEHKMPVTPTLVATLPSLAGRWASGHLIHADAKDPGDLNVIQGWFAGSSESAAFEELLTDYGIAVKEFSELNLLSSFLNLITRLPELSFAQVRKAVRILEKHSKATKAAAKNRPALFARLCELVASATPEDIFTLRNLNEEALKDLIAPLQIAIGRRIRSEAVSDPFIKNIEMAAESPNIWWSKPFNDWMKELSALPTLAAAQTLIRIMTSEKASKWAMARFERDADAEDKLLEALPRKLDQNATPLLHVAQNLKWMRLHAECMLRLQPEIEAIIAHAEVAGMRIEGLEWIYKKVGFIPLLQAACRFGTQRLIEYVGSLLQSHATEVLESLPAKCPCWPSILVRTITQSVGRINGPLRSLTVRTLAGQKDAAIAFADLCAACTSRDVTVWLDLEKPCDRLNLLAQETKSQTITKINAYIAEEVKAGRDVVVKNTINFVGILDVETIITAIASVKPAEAAKAGIAAFRSFPFLSDDDCRRWLIDLFTRTFWNRLEEDEASEIASVLLAADYPKSAAVVKETAEGYFRRDVVPIYDKIRYKYEMTQKYVQKQATKKSRLTKVVIATALRLERDAVIKILGSTEYDSKLFADVAQWPNQDPIFEVSVILTGPGNLEAQRAMLHTLAGIKPKLAFFVGIGGGIKDSDIGDVAYGTKVYYYEGGKEDKDGMKSRPVSERPSDTLVQHAHRVASQAWLPADQSQRSYKAIPAVIASGENVLASTDPDAMTFQHIKSSYNDTQIVEMEGYGFLNACRQESIRHCMVIRGVSDKLGDKAESDLKGNQPLAAQNAATFLFALLRFFADSTSRKEKKARCK